VRELEDFATVFCRSSRVVDSYELDNYREQLQVLNRVQRMGFKEDFELRTAIRELMRVKAMASIDPETKRAQELREIDRNFVGKEIPGFFPTPADLAAEVVALADIQSGHTVGEFSAGLGHIANAILENTDYDLSINLQLIEIRPDLCEALRKKGFMNIQCVDFLTCEPHESFDRVVINPPFENDQDAKHVQHAFKFLKPGGRLVAIMAGNKDQKRFADFIQWVESHGGVITPNEPGAFKSAFRTTGVYTCTLVIDK
jgi:phospholipid N-methyltransferase